MLWHRQAIFKSKGDKMCSSAECRIWTWGPRHQIASRLNACWQTDWADHPGGHVGKFIQVPYHYIWIMSTQQMTGNQQNDSNIVTQINGFVRCYGISTVNSLAPGRFQLNFRLVIFKLTFVNGGWGISYGIALRWMPLDLTDDKSTLVQVMAWCRQATSHYLSQWWPQIYVAKWRY